MKTRQKSRDASGILLVCLMWMLSLSSSLHAQTWNINGNVTDEQGEPIIGANVVIQGTGTGTITDVEGNFKLASVTKGAVMEKGTNYEEADYILYWIPLYLFICNSETDFGKAKR